MNNNQIIATSITCFIFGIFFFAYQEEWIVFMLPPSTAHAKVVINPQKHTKNQTVTLYAWIQNQYKKETSSIIWSTNVAHNIKMLLNNWLTFLEDERPTDKETQVTSVTLSPSGNDVFISFNQYPFEKQFSTHTKLMWIESLLKTMRSNNITINSVRFLVHHQALQDDHLNFECSWPLSGYLERSFA